MMKIGMVGVGSISRVYLENLANTFREIKLVGVCDLIKERALNAQKKYPDLKVYDTMYDLFADPEIDIVLNLTRPYQHFNVSKEALLHGKHVYSEKPLGATFEEGKELVELAEAKGLMIGGAPDTFMGAGLQTSRFLIDSGAIGKPIGGHCQMLYLGPESWHPDPEFLYKRGAGPMLDMGPYYITALINMLGGIKRIFGMAKITYPQRIITSEPHYGDIIDVEAPTFTSGLIEFDCGAVVSITTSFDVLAPEGVKFEIYGTKGTIVLPDPNCFWGPVKLIRPEDGGQVKDMPIMFDYNTDSRGLGLADFAKALETGRVFRTSYKQTLHVIEALSAFEKSSMEGKPYEMTTHFERVEPMHNNPMHGILD